MKCYNFEKTNTILLSKTNAPPRRVVCVNTASQVVFDTDTYTLQGFTLSIALSPMLFQHLNIKPDWEKNIAGDIGRKLITIYPK